MFFGGSGAEGKGLSAKPLNFKTCIDTKDLLENIDVTLDTSQLFRGWVKFSAEANTELRRAEHK